MSRDYAAFTTLIRVKLQTTSTADFSVAEIDSQIEECLKEYADSRPNLHEVVFKIESRYGMASTTSASNLVDTTKGQFLSSDPTGEKVVYNATDHTWAVVLSYADTATIGLSKDIFEKSEQYRIYNKRCWDSKQIYIGDMPDWLKIDSVEYPIGERRNWRIYNNEVLEVKTDYVEDSDASSIRAASSEPNVDVLVRFARPHILSQLTDWAGKVTATAAVGATTLAGSSLQSAGTIEEGEEFYVENHRSKYVIAASATISSNTVAFAFYPPLEAAVAATTWTFTFTKSSLKPNDEELFADLVTARLFINKSPKFLNTVTIGGGNVWKNYQDRGERLLGQTLARLRGEVKPKVKKLYTRE